MANITVNSGVDGSPRTLVDTSAGAGTSYSEARAGIGPSGNSQDYDTDGGLLLASASIDRLGAAIGGGSQLFVNAGAPVNGTSGTYAGSADLGAELVDTTNGVIYVNNNTLLSPTWVAVAGIPKVVSPTISGNAVTLSVLPNVTNLVAVSGFTSAGVISLPAAANNAGARFRSKIAGSASKTYSFSTNSSTGISKFVGGVPVYSTTAVPDYVEGFSDGTNWFATLVAIAMA